MGMNRGPLGSNLMPIAATFVVAVYAFGLLQGGEIPWYHWLALLGGAGFAVWYWSSELLRLFRRRRNDH